MSLGNSIRSGTKWLLVGTLSGQVFQFIFGIFLARLLLPSDFGLLVTIQVYTGIAWFFAGAGMAQSLLQTKEVTEKHFNVVFTIQLVIGIIIYLFFFLASPLFSLWYKEPIYTDLIKVSALSFLFRPFMANPTSRLMRSMRFKEISIIELITTIIGGVIGVLMALSGYKVWSLIVSGLFSSVIKILLLAYVVKWKPKLGYDKTIAKQLGMYGAKVTANSIVDYFKSQVDNFIVGKTIGPNELGLYNKGTSLSAIPITVVSGSTQQVIFSAMAKKQDDENALKYMYLRTITLLSVYTLPIYVGMMFLANPFIILAYGNKWVSAAPILQLMAITGIMRCVINPASAVSAACNLIKSELRINIESLLLVSLGCVLTIKHFGVLGVAISVVAGYIYLTLRLSMYIGKQIGIDYSYILTALRPALLMNFNMALMLFITKGIFEYFFMEYDNITYFTIMFVVGFIVYALEFLFIPPKDLISESRKWRCKLGIA